jgi:hypothetical protein
MAAEKIVICSPCRSRHSSLPAMFAFDSLFDMPILRFAPLHWKNVASGLIRRIGAMCHHHRLAADRETSAGYLWHTLCSAMRY